MAENYTTKFALTSAIKSKVKKIADAYFKETKNTITVTSGTRTASSQASAMYKKLAGGDKLKIYKDQTSAKAIKKAYDDGISEKLAASKIKSSMTKVIAAQVKKGKYISKHLKSGAVDIRSKDMSAKEKTAFRKAAKGIAKSILLESTPPHWHLQF